MQKIGNYLDLIRISNFTKNFFIFLPAFFGFRFNDYEVIIKLIIVFIGFCFVTAAVYIFNDLQDLEADKLHHKKKFRALASGRIDRLEALYIMRILILIGFSLIYLANYQATLIALLYMLMNFAYSLKLKHISILDVVIVSIGFVLRLFIGGIAVSVIIQPWIVVMTFLLSMFMVLAKRLDDLLIKDNANDSFEFRLNETVKGYNIKYLENGIVIMASTIIVAYLLYTLSPDVEARMGSINIYFTAIFVIVGIMRYLQIIFVEKNSGSPTEIFLKDRIIQISVALWLMAFAYFIYL